MTPLRVVGVLVAVRLGGRAALTILGWIVLAVLIAAALHAV